MLNGLGFQSLQVQEIFLLCKMSTPALGHPASYSVDIWIFFLGHKQLGCEADHLTPPGAEVNEWNSLYMPYWHTEGQLYCMHHV